MKANLVQCRLAQVIPTEPVATLLLLLGQVSLKPEEIWRYLQDQAQLVEA